MKLAILDDYQRVALRMADWSGLAKHCQIDVIDRALEVPGISPAPSKRLTLLSEISD